MSIVTDIFLPIALAFIMFALGLGLTGADFLRVLKQPKDFFVGAISQIILLPVIAFILVKIWPISPELAIGVMIIAAAPGGVTSNILTSFARGDVALSISLTAIISLLSVITVPFIIVTSLGFLGSEIVAQNISLTTMAISMFLIVTVPVIIGIIFRRFASNAAIKFEPIAKKISIILFVIVLLGAILAEKDNIVSYFADAGLITLALNVIMMIVAFYVAKLLGTGNAQKKCIAIECGLQNGTLALFVSTQIFGTNNQLTAASASGVYGLRLAGVAAASMSVAVDGDVTQTIGIGSTAIGKIIGYDAVTKTLQYWQDRSLATNDSLDNKPTYGYKLNRFTANPASGGNTNIIVTTTGGTETLSIDTGFTGVSTTVNSRTYYFGQTYNNGLANPEIKKYSGNMIYIDQRPEVTRATNQREDIKIILEF